MKNFNRRDFLKFGAAGMAGLATTVNFPMLQRGLALASSSASGNFFTIAVISDTQNYCDGRFQPASNGVVNLPFFTDQTTYLANNASAMKLAFVTHVGDIVQNGDGSTLVYSVKPNGGFPKGIPQNTEWLNAQEAMDVLAATDVPFGLTPGNHDYDNMDYSAAGNKYPPLVSTAPWWQATWGSGSKYFLGKSWYGGASDEVGYISTGNASVKGMWPPAGTPCNYGLSSYQLFSAGGKKFLHISLEMEAGDNAIAWAQGVIDLYPGYPTIVTTHSYLSPPTAANIGVAPLVVPAPYNSAGYLTNSPGGWNGATGIWSGLIAPNDQIFLVLCGHSFSGTSLHGVDSSENIRIDNNNSGHPVYQVLTDYQGNTTLGSAGGDGWYRFMQFDMVSNNIHFCTYNAFDGASAGQSTNVVSGQNDGRSDFDQPEAFSDFSLSMPVQVLNGPAQVNVVASGFVYSRAAKLYTGNLILTNTSVNPITGSVSVALNNLTSGVTLVNQAGTYNGAPYATVMNNGLKAGAKLVIPVQFSDPSNARINFTPVSFQE